MLLSSPKILLNQTWEIYKKRFEIFLGIMILPVTVSFLLTYLIALGASLSHSSSGNFVILGVVMLAFGAILSLGGVVVQLWGHTALLYAIKDREEGIGIKESYRRGWNKIISYFWISFLSGLIILGGFFLFFVPGLVFLIWFSLASFVLIYEDKKGWQALMKSREYIKGNWWGVFWRFLFAGIIIWLFLFLFNILFSFVMAYDFEKMYFYIGYVLSAPVATIYLSLIYENLKKINPNGSVIQDLESKK